MANVLIRDLEEADVVNPSDMLILEQDEEQTKKVKAETLLGDYVVDESSGTTQGLATGSVAGDSKCFYRKWASGILEIWGYRKSNNVSISSTSWANGFESVVDLAGGEHLSRVAVWGTYPVPFIDIPHVDYRITTTDAQEYSGDYIIVHSEYGQNDSSLVDPKTTSPSFKIWRGNKKTLYNPTITFRAIGHWK